MKTLNLGNKYFNIYLLDLGASGYCLIDTGYKWQYGKFLKKLDKNGIDKRKIKYLVITHAHADHVGFLKEIVGDIDPTVIYDPRQRARLEAGKNNIDVYITTFIALMSSKVTASSVFVDRFQCFPAVKTEKFVSYEKNPLKEFGIEFVPYGGHTDGDLALKAGSELYCGDICMNCFPSIKRAPLWVENKFALIKSWESILSDGSIATVFPIHGKPFDVRELKTALDYWRDRGVFKLFKKKD